MLLFALLGMVLLLLLQTGTDTVVVVDGSCGPAALLAVAAGLVTASAAWPVAAVGEADLGLCSCVLKGRGATARPGDPAQLLLTVAVAGRGASILASSKGKTATWLPPGPLLLLLLRAAVLGPPPLLLLALLLHVQFTKLALHGDWGLES